MSISFAFFIGPHKGGRRFARVFSICYNTGSETEHEEKTTGHMTVMREREWYVLHRSFD